MDTHEKPSLLKVSILTCIVLPVQSFLRRNTARRMITTRGLLSFIQSTTMTCHSNNLFIFQALCKTLTLFEHAFPDCVLCRETSCCHLPHAFNLQCAGPVIHHCPITRSILVGCPSSACCCWDSSANVSLTIWHFPANDF